MKPVVWVYRSERPKENHQMFDIHARTFPVWIWVRGDGFRTRSRGSGMSAARGRMRYVFTGSSVYS